MLISVKVKTDLETEQSFSILLAAVEKIEPSLQQALKKQ